MTAAPFIVHWATRPCGRPLAQHLRQESEWAQFSLKLGLIASLHSRSNGLGCGRVGQCPHPWFLVSVLHDGWRRVLLISAFVALS